MNSSLVRLRTINTRIFAYATVLVAYFLRVYRLADKNVWWDEGWSLWLARQNFAAIALRTAADEHPPLHYWMLRVWGSIAGWDVFTARFLSVLFGVLTVALLYRMGKRIGGTWVGVLAALFIAVARFHVWWSQDVKNYTPSIFFAFAAVWFGLNFIASSARARQSLGKLEGADWGSVLGYAACAALAMLTHYLAALVLLALNLYVLFIFFRKFYVLRFMFYAWLAANALAALVFAPWFVLYLQNAQTWSAQPAFDFGLFLKLVATALPLGVTTNINDYVGVAIGFTTIAILGCVPVIGNKLAANNSRTPTTSHRLLFALIVLIAPLLVYSLSLTPASFFAPKIQARYLLILYPAYATLVALGVVLLKRFSIYLSLAAALFVLASSAIVLRDYYAERRLSDDYATLANTINSFARQGDLVLLDTDQEWPTFLYYLRAPLDWLGAPNGKPMNDSDADSLVRNVLNTHQAVWLVTIPDALATDPQRKLQAQLARQLPQRFEQTFNDKRVSLYALDDRDFIEVPQGNLHIQRPLPFIPFRNGSDPNQYQALLTGYDMPVREARAGDTVYVTTYWHAVATRGEIQLYDSANRSLNSTPFDLATGKDVRVVTGLNVPPDLSGSLTVRVRVAAQSVEIARVSVEQRAPAGAGNIAHPVDYQLGDAIHLIGYDLPQTKFRAGESVPVSLFWRADQPVAKSYVAFVHLLGSEFNAPQDNFLWGQMDQVPRAGTYPTTAWRASETVGDPVQVPIAINAPPGKYQIEVGMYDLATGERLQLGDGKSSILVAEIEIVR